MNCKPGDLAVIVREAKECYIGHVCTVKEAALFDEDGANWLCEFTRPVLICWDDGTGAELTRNAIVPDAWLRPIRDPGDNAKDETLDWLPVPQKEIA